MNSLDKCGGAVSWDPDVGSGWLAPGQARQLDLTLMRGPEDKSTKGDSTYYVSKYLKAIKLVNCLNILYPPIWIN